MQCFLFCLSVTSFWLSLPLSFPPLGPFLPFPKMFLTFPLFFGISIFRLCLSLTLLLNSSFFPLIIIIITRNSAKCHQIHTNYGDHPIHTITVGITTKTSTSTSITPPLLNYYCRCHGQPCPLTTPTSARHLIARRARTASHTRPVTDSSFGLVAIYLPKTLGHRVTHELTVGSFFFPQQLIIIMTSFDMTLPFLSERSNHAPFRLPFVIYRGWT